MWNKAYLKPGRGSWGSWRLTSLCPILIMKHSLLSYKIGSPFISNGTQLWAINHSYPNIQKTALMPLVLDLGFHQIKFIAGTSTGVLWYLSRVLQGLSMSTLSNFLIACKDLSNLWYTAHIYRDAFVWLMDCMCLWKYLLISHLHMTMKYLAWAILNTWFWSGSKERVSG